MNVGELVSPVEQSWLYSLLVAISDAQINKIQTCMYATALHKKKYSKFYESNEIF